MDEVVKYTIKVSVDHIKQAAENHLGREVTEEDLRELKSYVKSTLKDLEEDFLNDYGVEECVQNYYENKEYEGR